jgi:UDP-N-acetylmuramate: L-alanyl-gamma-D-glutamyl-meso-diaminopimelate ligase
VVVGNVCRRDNPEAMRAAELGHELLSMPGAIARLLLPGRRSLVVAGTHGKTTTTALLGSILAKAGLDPTILVGGVSLDLGGSSRLGQGPHVVIEGDEYDSAFFEKVPKFWSYAPWAAILGSIEHDHLDIYPDEASYIRAFEGLVDRLPADGLLAAWAGDPLVMEAASRARCRVVPFALTTDRLDRVPRSAVVATLRERRSGAHRLELRVRWPDGASASFGTPLAGEHNARNALAAIVLCREACGLAPVAIGAGLASFKGVALRQQLIGTRRSVRVYRDFAHHPGAVSETIRAMGPLARPGRLVVAYEPRSATACRRIHQDAYARAFAHADVVVLAPVGRPEIPAEERLDTQEIARELRAQGIPATASSSLDQLVGALAARVRPGDLVLLLSNGHFGNADRRLLERLETRR